MLLPRKQKGLLSKGMIKDVIPYFRSVTVPSCLTAVFDVREGESGKRIFVWDCN